MHESCHIWIRQRSWHLNMYEVTILTLASQSHFFSPPPPAPLSSLSQSAAGMAKLRVYKPKCKTGSIKRVVDDTVVIGIHTHTRTHAHTHTHTCKHTYTHKYTHTHKDTHTHTHTHTLKDMLHKETDITKWLRVCVSVCVRVCVCACVRVCIYACLSLSLSVCLFVCACLSLFLSVCLFVCVCVCSFRKRPVQKGNRHHQVHQSEGFMTHDLFHTWHDSFHMRHDSFYTCDMTHFKLPKKNGHHQAHQSQGFMTHECVTKSWVNESWLNVPVQWISAQESLTHWLIHALYAFAMYGVWIRNVYMDSQCTVYRFAILMRYIDRYRDRNVDVLYGSLMCAICICNVDALYRFAMSIWIRSVYMDSQCLYGFAMSIWIRNVYMDSQCLYGFAMSIWIRNVYMDSQCLYGFAMSIWIRNVYMDSQCLYGFAMSTHSCAIWIRNVYMDSQCLYGFAMSIWIRSVYMDSQCLYEFAMSIWIRNVDSFMRSMDSQCIWCLTQWMRQWILIQWILSLGILIQWILTDD